MKTLHRQIIAIVFASLLISFSAEASYTAEVGCITIREFEGVKKLGENLTDRVTSNDQVEPMNGDQVEPMDTALLYRRWGRLTRRFRGSW
jgi:hypothetical protein